MATYHLRDDDDDEHLLVASEDDADDDEVNSELCLSSKKSTGKASHYTAATRHHSDGENVHDIAMSSSESEPELGSRPNSSCTSSSSSSPSWEMFDEHSKEVLGEEETRGIIGSVSREAKQMVTGLKVDMKEISDGYSMIASGVDKMTTGIADRLNRAFSEGAKQAGHVVSNWKRDWLEKPDADGNLPKEDSVTEINSDPMISNKPNKDNNDSANKSASASSLPPSQVPPIPSDQSTNLDNRNKTNNLRKITSVIYNNSALLPVNLKALHTEGVFSQTCGYTSSQPVASEISFCGPSEQMIIETQQNDPFDPIAVLVVYELFNSETEESIGYLRLQAVWHCFEPTPHVGVSLGSEPTPSSDADSLTSLQPSGTVKIRCIAKQLDSVENDYYVQSITLVSEETATFMGRTFDKLMEKFKAF